MKLEHPNVDNILRKNLEGIQKSVLNDDWDCLGIIDGKEGAGKSVMAQQVAQMLSTKPLDIENIVFTPRQFKRTILNSEKYEVIIWDEARSGLNSRRSMSSINNTIVDMLAEIRQKNLFIIIVMPTFFDMDKNVALWRSKFLIHVMTDENRRRGFFRAYNEEDKKILYINGKKEYNYSKFIAKPTFSGKFGNYYHVDEEEYRKKKLKNLRAANLDTQGIKDFLENIELYYLQEFRDAEMLKQGSLQQYAKWKGWSPSNLSHKLKRMKPLKEYIKSDVLEDLKLDT